MIRSLVVVCVLLAAGAVEAAAPVAMVLTTRGKVTLERGPDNQPLRAMDLLRPGDVLQADDGEAVLILLDDGRRERLRPGAGPPSATRAVHRRRPSSARETSSCRPGNWPACATWPAAAGPASACCGPAAADAAGRHAHVRRHDPDGPADADLAAAGEGRQLPGGTVERQRPAAALAGDDLGAASGLPGEAGGAEAGVKYLWGVRARLGEARDLSQVVDSKFSTATRAEAAELAALKPLAASADAADLLLAAATYEAHGVYGEALALYEKLAEKLPAEANVQVALASYYERGGHPDRARVAREKANKLGAELPEK